MATNPYPDPERAELLFALDKIALTKRLTSAQKREAWDAVCGAMTTPETATMEQLGTLKQRLEAL